MYKCLYIIFLFIPFLLPGQGNRQQRIDSLLTVLSKMENDSHKVKQLESIAYNYASISPEKSVDYSQKCLELSEEINWTKGKALSYAALGMAHRALSDYRTALKYDQEALLLYTELHDGSGVSAMLTNIGIDYLNVSDYPNSLEYFFRALKFTDSIGNKNSVAIITENIGSIYFEQKKYNKSEEYYLDALKKYTELGYKKGITRVSGNIARVYSAEGKHDSALKYHFNALNANRELGNKHSVQINLANIGLVYSQLKNYPKALEYQFEALAISEELNNKNSMAINLGNIGETYFAMGTGPAVSMSAGRENLQKAIDYLEKAITICRETGFSGPQIEFSRFLSDAYDLAGNHEKAFRIYKEHTSLKDSVFSKENNVKLAELEAKHKLDLKDKDIVIHDKQLEIAGLVAANKRKERAIYISGIVLLVVLAGALITRALLRIRRQKNALSEIARIQSHDVRGPVSKILGLTQLFNHEDTTDPVNKEVIKYISNTATEMDEIINTVVNKTQAGR